MGYYIDFLTILFYVIFYEYARHRKLASTHQTGAYSDSATLEANIAGLAPESQKCESTFSRKSSVKSYASASRCTSKISRAAAC